VKGRAKIMYKPKGSKNKTVDLTPKEALTALKEGI
jgi:hypothetical protein